MSRTIKDTLLHLKALEEIQKTSIPGLVEVLHEEGIDAVRYVLQRVALLLSHPYRRCTILAQGSSRANIGAPLVDMVQLQCKPLYET